MIPENRTYWSHKKVILKHNYPNITDNDLQFREGKEMEMMEMLGYKLGKSKAELTSIINAL
jgi:hypothetical protein